LRSLRLERQSKPGQHLLKLVLTHPPRFPGIVKRHRFPLSSSSGQPIVKEDDQRMSTVSRHGVYITSIPLIGNDRIAKVRVQAPRVVGVEFEIFMFAHCVCLKLFVASTCGAAPTAASALGMFPLAPLALDSAEGSKDQPPKAVELISLSVTLCVRGASPQDAKSITGTCKPP